MVLIAIAVAVVGLVVGIFLARRAKARRKLARYSIEAEELHALLESKHDVLVLDVRLPLDLLTDSEIIRGAVRISPRKLLPILGLSQRRRRLWFIAHAPATRPAGVF